MNRAEFMEEVLRLFAFDDCSELFWRGRDSGGEFPGTAGEIDFYVDCSDVFGWALADTEKIEPEDLPDLLQAKRDVAAVSEIDSFGDLWAARKRKMLPQQPYLKRCDPAVVKLFEEAVK